MENNARISIRPPSLKAAVWVLGKQIRNTLDRNEVRSKKTVS